MNLTMTVKMTLMLFLLCSGFSQFTFASNRLRVFRFPGTEEKEFDDVLTDCENKTESFVTLYDEEDADFAVKFVNEPLTNGGVWLGLRKVRNITWSDGFPVIFNKSSVNLANNLQRCEAIDNGNWTGFNCSEEKYFMCNNGINYTLIESKKNWCQALQYCRKLNTNLVRINSETENNNVIDKGKNTSFWIGLMYDEWEWMDKSCSSFRRWGSQNDGGHSCTQFNTGADTKTMYQQQCNGGNSHSFCSKGATRIKVINQNLTWEEAFNYCKAKHTGLLWIEDKDDQFAVEQWLNHTEVPGPFWIGLRQSRVFGFWIWSDRTVAYSNWRNGTQPELPMCNQCGAISKSDYKWSDEDCLVPRPFLCEEEIVFMNPYNSPSLL